MALKSLTVTGRTLAVIAVLLVATAGGASATGGYDAQNADKVDGRHAVGPGADAATRAGKLVATWPSGKLPAGAIPTVSNSKRLDGYTHGQMATMSIPPQSTFVTSGASQGSSGPNLPSATDGAFSTSFVVPPDHVAGTRLRMRVVYLDNQSDACAWYVYADGLEGPDGPNSGSNVHNGGWLVPGTSAYDGPVNVPAGAGSVHAATFSWPFQSDPGMFIQFTLSRDGANAADTCSDIAVVGLELFY